MIQFQNVSKRYGRDIVALDNINFEIQEGEFAFLIGSSGSGKTTLIKMLIREETPSEGKIYFDNEDITRLSRGKIYQHRRKVGVIFQDYKLIEEKTAYENLEFVMEAAGKPSKEIKETVPYLLDIVGLADRQKAFPKELSGGEKQRVAIARALVNNPKLLIADEPTGNLDPEAAWDIVRILQKINDWGTTVLMSTHGLDIVEQVAKRVLRIQDGNLVEDIVGDFKSHKQKKKEDFESKLIEITSEKPVKLFDGKEEKKDHKKYHKKNEPKEESVIEETKIEEPIIETVEIITDTVEIPVEETKEAPQEIIEEKQVEVDKVVEEEKVEETKKEETILEEPKASEEKEEIKEEKHKTEHHKEEKKEHHAPKRKGLVEPPPIKPYDDEVVNTEETPKVEEESKPKHKLKISLVDKKNKHPLSTKREKSNLDSLDMDSKIINLIKDSGYKSVEDVIEAGIGKMEEIEGINKQEAEQIKSAVAKFIQNNL